MMSCKVFSPCTVVPCFLALVGLLLAMPSQSANVGFGSNAVGGAGNGLAYAAQVTVFFGSQPAAVAALPQFQ